MKSESILKRIRKYVNSDNSTKTQKEVGNYIINNYEELPDMKLKEFIAIVNASKSTVIRFLKNFNLNGYKELVFLIESEINDYDTDLPSIDKDNIGIKISNFFSILALHDEEKNFTPAEKKVFNYLINNLQQIPSLGIEEFAQRADVSTSTISNFISSYFNIKNYLELKELLSVHFERQESLSNFLSDPYSSYSYKPEHSFLELDTVSSLLNSIERNIYKIIGSMDIDNKFNNLIKKAANILIFDPQNTTINLLHNNLNHLGFLNLHFDSYDKTIKNIESLRKNRELKTKNIDKSATELNKNLIIIMATYKYNKKINDIIEKSLDSNFSIILFEANHTFGAIGEYPEIDLRINIGTPFVVSENNTRETITLTIILEMLINEFKNSL